MRTGKTLRLASLCVTFAVLGAAPVAAQIPNLWEGEAMLGLVGQNDTQKLDRVQLSPLGLNIGFIAQPIFNKRRLSFSDQLSFYPAINYDRPKPFDTLPPPSNNPLILNTAWVRLSSNEPELGGETVYFVGVGAGVSISTPRDGQRVAPVLGVGIRHWFPRQLGFEISLQCSAPKLGRTVCQLPVTSVWPFGGSKKP